MAASQDIRDNDDRSGASSHAQRQLRTARTRLDLSLQDAARLLKVSPHYLQMAEDQAVLLMDIECDRIMSAYRDNAST